MRNLPKVNHVNDDWQKRKFTTEDSLHNLSDVCSSDVVKTQATKTKTWTFKTKTETQMFKTKTLRFNTKTGTKTHDQELVKDNLLCQDTNQNTIFQLQRLTC